MTLDSMATDAPETVAAQAPAFNTSLYTLHSQGAEAVSTSSQLVGSRLQSNSLVWHRRD